MSLTNSAMTVEHVRSVAYASRRVITGFMRSAPEGTDAGELATAVIRTFAELANPAPVPVKPQPLQIARRQRTRNTPPRKRNLSRGSIIAATIEEPGAPDDSQAFTGFLATLTDEQRAAALAYTGDDHHGPKVETLVMPNVELGPRIDVSNVDPASIVIEATPSSPAMEELQAKPRIRVQAGSSKTEVATPSGNWRKLT